MANTYAYIHLKNLSHNLARINAIAQGRKILPAVKANAYGHGAVEIAKHLEKQGISSLAVATLEEAMELRESGLKSDIVILGLMCPSDAAVAVKNDFCLFCSDIGYIKMLENSAKKIGQPARINLEIDTGMGRTGCMPEEAFSIAEYIDKSPYLMMYGISTHFPVSELADDDFTASQIASFYKTVELIKKRGIDTGYLHLANSGAIINYPDSLADMIRPGISLYGYVPDTSLSNKVSLKPVMELLSKVIFIKRVKKGSTISYGRRWQAPCDTLIATVGAGYADGYCRLLSGKAKVRIKDRLYPVVGTICMDQFMIDLGPASDVKLYDDVVLFGPSGPDAQDLAELIGTIPYEITCAVSSRVKRVYIN
ncbi:alanine racemase [Spirochaetia bacterium 38H-sp]|uniref:Alanine racemase n=1 Tax=Rarispira pelagica TaxID=3141764 RepID=A0ABU9UDK7_9SPIR